MKKDKKIANRLKRKERIRKKIFGTDEKPRFTVFKSNRYLYAQLIDDMKGETLVFASTQNPSLREHLKSTKDQEAAKRVGELVAKAALEKGIRKVVFDRNGYLFHGKIKAMADTAREAGLEF